MLIVSQSGLKAYNLNRYDAIGVQENCIAVEREGRSYAVGRYESEEKAQEVFDNLMEDLSRSSALPFEESANPYWLPSEG